MILEQVDNETTRIIILPNCSMSWQMTKLVMVALSLVALMPGLFVAAQGNWIVLPFAGLEVLVLVYAFYASAHKQRCRELVEIGPEQVKVEIAAKRLKKKFQRYWLKYKYDSRVRNQPNRLWLYSHGDYVELASQLHEDEKKKLVHMLSSTLT